MERKKRSAEDQQKKKKKLKDPFLRRKVECPVCEHGVEQLGLKTNLFRAEHKDLDLRPYSYRWEQENLARFHPPFYYVWYCPKCYFAAGRKFYEDPLKGCFLSSRKLREKVLEGYKKDMRIRKTANKLTTDIKRDDMNYISAIKLHLMAVFWLEQFKEFTKRDAMNLARYYIRIAWLLRDLSEDENARETVQPDLDALFTDIKTVWPECVDNETDALRRAVHFYEVTISCSEIIENAVDELNVLLIVAKIYLKLEDLKPALDALTAAVTSGTRAKQEIDTELRAPIRDDEMNPALDKKRKAMQQESHDLRGLIDRCRNLLDKVKADWMEQQTNKAKGLIAANKSGKTREQLRQFLLDQKIEQRIVNRLVPEEDKNKKKGFLAGLFGG